IFRFQVLFTRYMGRSCEDYEELFYEEFDYEYFQYEELTWNFEICLCGRGHCSRFYKISSKPFKCEKKSRFNKSRRNRKRCLRWEVKSFNYQPGLF
ncbi:hypothetical protein Anas_14394, partial [Armadillidium nasatum]